MLASSFFSTSSPSSPKPLIFIATVLDLLPCLPQALFTDGELRLRARRYLMDSHGADRWRHRILGLGHLSQVQWHFQIDTKNVNLRAY